jgi:hypothetical protein
MKILGVPIGNRGLTRANGKWDGGRGYGSGGEATERDQEREGFSTGFLPRGRGPESEATVSAHAEGKAAGLGSFRNR